MNSPFSQSIHPCLCANPLQNMFLYFDSLWFDAYVLINEPILTLTSAPDAPGMSSAIFLRLMPRVRFIFLEWIFRMSRRAWWCRNVQSSNNSHTESCEVLLDAVTNLFIRRGELYLPVDPAWPEQSWVQDVDTVGGHDDLQRERETVVNKMINKIICVIYVCFNNCTWIY